MFPKYYHKKQAPFGSAADRFANEYAQAFAAPDEVQISHVPSTQRLHKSNYIHKNTRTHISSSLTNVQGLAMIQTASTPRLQQSTPQIKVANKKTQPSIPCKHCFNCRRKEHGRGCRARPLRPNYLQKSVDANHFCAEAQTEKLRIFARTHFEVPPIGNAEGHRGRQTARAAQESFQSFHRHF